MMILTFDDSGFLAGHVREILISIDITIYKIISWILEGIFNLAELSAKRELVETIYKNVYIILAVFMVFKLTVAFLQYIVDPDKMTDKESGIGKIIAKVITMFALMIIFPIIVFTPMSSYSSIARGIDKPILQVLQSGVLKTLPKLLMGKENNPDKEVNEEVANEAGKNGKELALNMIEFFFYPSECDSDSSSTNSSGTTSGTSCNAYHIGDFNDLYLHVNDRNNGKYYYQYMWPLTTVAGVVLVIILIGIAVDVAVRTFKLIILEMIAPIPIMSYIDPKSSKDGAFSSWLKEFIKTFLDLFFKLGSIYILLLLLSRLFIKNDQALFKDIDKLGFSAKGFVYVFLTIGLFKFVKDIPKFVKDVLGIKDSGDGGVFGGLKSIGTAAGFLGGTAAGLAGGIAGGVAANKAADGSRGMGFLKGLGGGIAGAFRGGASGFSGAKSGNPIKGLSGAVSAQNNVTKKKMAAASAGSTFGGRMKTRADEFFKGQTAADRDKELVDDYKEAIDSAKDFKSVLADSAGKSDAMLNVGGRNVNLKQFKGVLAAANAGDKSAISALKDYGFAKPVTTTFKDKNGRTITARTMTGDLAAANAGAAGFEKEFQKAYYNEITSNRTAYASDGDAQAVFSAKSVADASLRGLNVGYSEVTANNAGTVIGKVTEKSNAIKSSRSYKANKANAEAVKRSK